MLSNDALWLIWDWILAPGFLISLLSLIDTPPLIAYHLLFCPFLGAGRLEVMIHLLHLQIQIQIQIIMLLSWRLHVMILIWKNCLTFLQTFVSPTFMSRVLHSPPPPPLMPYTSKFGAWLSFRSLSCHLASFDSSSAFFGVPKNDLSHFSISFLLPEFVWSSWPSLVLS